MTRTELADSIRWKRAMRMERKLHTLRRGFEAPHESYRPAADAGRWPLLFSPGIRAAELILAARTLHTSPVTFIDVGCGVGDKMLLASEMDLVPFGVEIEHVNVLGAAKLMSSVGREDLVEDIVEKDALQYDYFGYDIVYLYCPVLQRHMHLLVHQIYETMSDDALLVVFGRAILDGYPAMEYLRNNFTEAVRPPAFGWDSVLRKK